MNPIRVLIIDDSAFARKAIREVLSRDPAIEIVGIARDGLEGLEKISTLRPDVVTLDLIMPELDGLGVLEALQSTWSPKVIVVSVSGSETELAIRALHMGAVDVVAKPTALASDKLYELSDELIGKVKVAMQARPRAEVAATTAVSKRAIALPRSRSSAQLLVIGTSTGGPQAISELFKTLPANLPMVIAVALHIPEGYTTSLAARITQASAIKMSEAVNGAELVAGDAVIAPGGQHLKIQNRSGRFYAIVTREPSESLHHPSVDVLFASAAKAGGAGVIGLIMTGMGSDGLEGSRSVRAAGGKILAESASSCVVYGMPRTVIEAGLANAEAPLPDLSSLVVRHAYGMEIL